MSLCQDRSTGFKQFIPLAVSVLRLLGWWDEKKGTWGTGYILCLLEARGDGTGK